MESQGRLKINLGSCWKLYCSFYMCSLKGEVPSWLFISSKLQGILCSTFKKYIIMYHKHIYIFHHSLN